MLHISTEIMIHASAEHVWKILTTFEEYPAWNPFFQSIQGVLQKGQIIKISLYKPHTKKKGMTFFPAVLVCDHARKLRWKGKLLFKGIFDGEHYFQIESINAHTVKFIHGEIFSGILIPIMKNNLRWNLQSGFDEMNYALKAQAERVS
nr:SRPBCC domain-containing protein [Acinetobacter sp. Marseille-Q1620]